MKVNTIGISINKSNTTRQETRNLENKNTRNNQNYMNSNYSLNFKNLILIRPTPKSPIEINIDGKKKILITNKDDKELFLNFDKTPNKQAKEFFKELYKEIFEKQEASLDCAKAYLEEELKNKKPYLEALESDKKPNKKNQETEDYLIIGLREEIKAYLDSIENPEKRKKAAEGKNKSIKSMRKSNQRTSAEIALDIMRMSKVGDDFEDKNRDKKTSIAIKIGFLNNAYCNNFSEKIIRCKKERPDLKLLDDMTDLLVETDLTKVSIDDAVNTYRKILYTIYDKSFSAVEKETPLQSILNMKNGKTAAEKFPIACLKQFTQEGYLNIAEHEEDKKFFMSLYEDGTDLFDVQKANDMLFLFKLLNILEEAKEKNYSIDSLSLSEIRDYEPSEDIDKDKYHKYNIEAVNEYLQNRENGGFISIEPIKMMDFAKRKVEEL